MTLRTIVAAVGAVMLIASGMAVAQLPAMGAGGLLHPSRRPVTMAPPAGCRDTAFDGDGVSLRGWTCATASPPAGTIVYLHGVADNRESGAGVIGRFAARGFDVIAYDSRAHGQSSGDACTYGFYEKRDLHRVLDTARPGPIVLIGTSLGAAVAPQEAAGEPRVSAIVAAESFSDLRTVAVERAPFVFVGPIFDRAVRLAEQHGAFAIDEVNPARDAARIRIPVLLVHGAADTDTPPSHSERILTALAGPKRLILVPGAHHNESLRGDDWREVEAFLFS